MDKSQEILKKGSFEHAEASGRLSWSVVASSALDLVLRNVPVVLFGPPGTGKTRMAIEIRDKLQKRGLLGNFQLIQFHLKFSYEDFIEGYVPSEKGFFAKRNGIFKSFCESCKAEAINLFVIDEINRAELTTTFGETLFLIEDRKDRFVYTAHFHDKFSIPPNVSIIGTMNTADRSIAKMDYALRRRFNFLPVFPDKTELQTWLNTTGFAVGEFSVEDYLALFEKINKRISRHPLMGHFMQLGQSMFVPRIEKGPITIQHIVDNFQEVILPQVEAYCGYGNENEMQFIFNPLVAEKYLSMTGLLAEDIASLVNDVKNEK